VKKVQESGNSKGKSLRVVFIGLPEGNRFISQSILIGRCLPENFLSGQIWIKKI